MSRDKYRPWNQLSGPRRRLLSADLSCRRDMLDLYRASTHVPINEARPAEQAGKNRRSGFRGEGEGEDERSEGRRKRRRREEERKASTARARAREDDEKSLKGSTTLKAPRARPRE